MLEVLTTDAFEDRFLRGDRYPELDPGVADAAREVLDAVRMEGDRAVARFTERFDGARVPPEKVRVPEERLSACLDSADPMLLRALEVSVARIRAFHEEQVRPGYVTMDSPGCVAGQLLRPLERAGIYVPGGRAAYPSSLIMGAIPAQVAGVSEVVVCSPPGPDGEISSVVLITAAMLGISEIYRVGGVQAIGAMAFGTETMRAVDKIVGPGNSYVTAAKKEVFGRVGIDGIAGPSELVVVCDEAADPALVAMDLMAQAEHDPEARVYLLTTDFDMARAVLKTIEEQGPTFERWEIIRKAMSDWGGVAVGEEDALWALSNALAPEHLSIQTRDPWRDLARVTDAGAVFLGAAAAVSFGDYSAGPNHVLPTAGTARYASALGVDDFLRRSSYLYLADDAAARLAPYTAYLADVEGLTGHGRAARARGDEKS